MFRHSIYWVFLLLALHANAWTLDKQYQVFDGGNLDLHQQIGKKPVYIKFWATWCLDCRRELPHLQSTFEKYKDHLSIYAVNLNINETDEFIRKLQQEHHLTIPIVMDNNGTIASNFQFYGTPFHALIDADGKLVYTSYKDDGKLAEELEKLAASKSTHKIELAKTNHNILPKQLMSGHKLVYFSATWCDWYMKDIHPDMASNCINAARLMNQIHQEHKSWPLESYVTHLWTEQTDVEKYIANNSIGYPVEIDQHSNLAHHFTVQAFPSLLILHDGKEIKRFTDFSSPNLIKQELNKILDE